MNCLKILSYTFFTLGIGLFSIIIMNDLSGFIGYLSALLALFFIIAGCVLNKKIREFFIDLILNFF